MNQLISCLMLDRHHSWCPPVTWVWHGCKKPQVYDYNFVKIIQLCASEFAWSSRIGQSSWRTAQGRRIKCKYQSVNLSPILVLVLIQLSFHTWCVGTKRITCVTFLSLKDYVSPAGYGENQKFSWFCIADIINGCHFIRPHAKLHHINKPRLIWASHVIRRIVV